jgi:hypothetical protein
MIASLGSVWLQKTKVCDCKNCCFISVTSKKRKIELVFDFNYLACVIATGSYVCCKKRNLTLSVCLQSYLVIWNMIASLGQCKKCKKLLGYLGNMIASLCSVWLQKLLVYFCACKKEKRKIEPVCDCNYLSCVIATSNYVWLQKKK